MTNQWLCNGTENSKDGLVITPGARNWRGVGCKHKKKGKEGKDLVTLTLLGWELKLFFLVTKRGLFWVEKLFCLCEETISVERRGGKGAFRMMTSYNSLIKILIQSERRKKEYGL